MFVIELVGKECGGWCILCECVLLVVEYVGGCCDCCDGCGECWW